MGEHTFDADVVLERVRELPGGRELIDLARGRTDVELVGGAVRDLMLGREPRELDVAVGGRESFPGAASIFARELALRLDAASHTIEHERFGTALVVWDGGRVDIASRRAESYPVAGALPEVRAGTPEEDLRRRDFTVDAIAVTLDTTRPGEVRAPPGALDDLRTGRLRVLHDASFLDDPTRLLRLARYRARLGFTVEEHTSALAGAAVAADALATISLARVGAELRLALGETNMVAALAAIDDLGLLKALPADLRFHEQTAHRALALLSEAGAKDTRPDLALLAALLAHPGYPLYGRIHDEARSQIAWFLDELEFVAADRDLVLKTLVEGKAIAEGLAFANTPSKIHAIVSHIPLETIALVSAKISLSSSDDDHPTTVAARRWLTELHSVRLQITGADLIARGVPQGPEIGHRLNVALRRKLDGELADSRDAELTAALEAHP